MLIELSTEMRIAISFGSNILYHKNIFPQSLREEIHWKVWDTLMPIFYYFDLIFPQKNKNK